MIATLKRFGLLEPVGGKKSGEVKLSELSLKIILDERPSSPNRAAAIKRAALNPPIYNELWAHWSGELPDDETVYTYLKINKGLDDAAVKGFLDDFKKTIAFAKLTPDDMMPPARRRSIGGKRHAIDDDT